MAALHRDMTLFIFLCCLLMAGCILLSRAWPNGGSSAAAALLLLLGLAYGARWFWRKTERLRMPWVHEFLSIGPLAVWVMRMIITLELIHSALGTGELALFEAGMLTVENPFDRGLESGLTLLSALFMTLMMEVEP